MISSLIGILAHDLGFALPVTIVILMPFLFPLSRATAVPRWLACMHQWITHDSKAQLLGVGWKKLLAKCGASGGAEGIICPAPASPQRSVRDALFQAIFPFPRSNAILSPVPTHPPSGSGEIHATLLTDKKFKCFWPLILNLPQVLRSNSRAIF